MGKLIEDFPHLIEDGDKILVALSGGEDSIALMDALWRKRRKSPVKYEIGGVMLAMGWSDTDPRELQVYLEDRGIPFYFRKTEISRLVEEGKGRRNPCSICSSYRRTYLYGFAELLGYNKLALGHHLDDTISSFFMSLLYTGEIRTTCPMVKAEDKDIYIIRPLSYVRKRVISRYVRKMKLPLVDNGCPYAGDNNRSWIEKWFAEVEERVRFADANILGALRRSGIIFKER